MIFVGVDPGKNGAVAAVDSSGTVLGISRFIHAETEGRIALIILDFVAELDPDDIKAATIERVGAMPRQGVVSMFTLDGRMRFQINLSADQEAHFVQDRLREVVLQNRSGVYSLSFVFVTAEPTEAAQGQPDEHFPEYLVVQQPPAAQSSDISGDTPDKPALTAVDDRGRPLLTGVA